ncbi:MAG TPA: alpha/beta fold hydrolase [Ktedonobacteraceae bacterium]|nr:alpha/beta fold hydrolase [Ktedonobacteraceae bacterium]
MTSTRDPRWIVRHRPQQEACLRLFCLPYAGGSASLYRTWAEALSPEIEVGAVELPGRGTRQAEPPYTRFAALVAAVTEVLLPFSDKDMAFYGHSLGGLLAFEVARALQRHSGKPAMHLIVSGCRAPHLPDDGPDMADVETFLTYLRALGGTPHEQMVRRRWPLLQADFALRASYHYESEGPLLACPITALRGEHDSAANESDTAAWREQAQHTFTQETFPGPHFFVHSAQDVLLQCVKRCLCGTTREGRV